MRGCSQFTSLIEAGFGMQGIARFNALKSLVPALTYLGRGFAVAGACPRSHSPPTPSLENEKPAAFAGFSLEYLVALTGIEPVF